jgi:hypothetical protein
MNIDFKCACGEELHTDNIVDWDTFESNHFEHFENIPKRYPAEYVVDEIW